LRSASSFTLLALAGSLGAVPAVAQSVRRDVSPLELPRPGYEYDGFHAGAATILVRLDAETQYDSNLFATSTNTIDDIRFELAPSVELKRDFAGGGKLRADVYGRLRLHADNPREDSEAFGGAASYAQTSQSGRRFLISGSYDRVIEARGDPETRAGPTDRPRKIDDFRGELEWRQPLGRMFAEARFAAEKVNYLDPAENDRDLSSYRGSLRLAYRLSPDANVFAEGYVNRRDYRLAFDFSGVNRDATTLGIQAGVQKELGQRLRGRFGVGLFRANPDSPALDAFTGFGASGELVWNPQTRTAISLRLSRGDVATVRSGATGRIDSTVRLTLDQEVRHNLLARVSFAYADRSYRGSARGHLKTVSSEAEVQYLVNRRWTLFAGASFADRNALGAVDRFERVTVSAGVRFKL
jgi:hypothetical protein